VYTKLEVSPPEPFLRFSQRTCPIHYFRSKTHVWGGFAQFRCRTSPIPITGVGVHIKHEFLPPEPILRFSQRTCPIHYFRSKTHVWGGFAQFRCRTSPIPKTGVGVHTSTSFCHRNHFFVFRNEHAESTTLGPKLKFGVVSRNFVVVRQPIPKTGVRVHTKHEFLQPEPILRFSQRTCPIHYFRSKTHVWGGFAPHVTHCENGCRGAYKARVFPPEPFLRFSQRTYPIHYFRSKTHVWGGFTQFRCRTSPIPRTGVGVHMSFRQRNHFFVLRNEHAQSTTLGPKLMFGWFRSISLPHVTHSENGCRGAYKARVFATGTISSFFATNMPNPLL
jgi:hypothetical protein